MFELPLITVYEYLRQNVDELSVRHPPTRIFFGIDKLTIWHLTLRSRATSDFFISSFTGWSRIPQKFNCFRTRLLVQYFFVRYMEAIQAPDPCLKRDLVAVDCVPTAHTRFIKNFLDSGIKRTRRRVRTTRLTRCLMTVFASAQCWDTPHPLVKRIDASDRNWCSSSSSSAIDEPVNFTARNGD